MSQQNPTNKLSISSIKLEVPVLPFTNQTQDNTQQVNQNKLQWAVKRLYKKHDWKIIGTHKKHTEQLKHLCWQILWYFLTTAFLSTSFVCFIECVPNIYVYTYWDNSTFQVNLSSEFGDFMYTFYYCAIRTDFRIAMNKSTLLAKQINDPNKTIVLYKILIHICNIFVNNVYIKPPQLPVNFY